MQNNPFAPPQPKMLHQGNILNPFGQTGAERFPSLEQQNSQQQQQQQQTYTQAQFSNYAQQQQYPSHTMSSLKQLAAAALQAFGLQVLSGNN